MKKAIGAIIIAAGLVILLGVEGKEFGTQLLIFATGVATMLIGKTIAESGLSSEEKAEEV